MYTWQSLSLMHVSNDFITGQILLWMAAQTTNITPHESTMHTPCTHIHIRTYTHSTEVRSPAAHDRDYTSEKRHALLHCPRTSMVFNTKDGNQTSVCVFLPSLVDTNCMYVAAMTLQGSVQPKPFLFATKHAYIFPSVIQYKLPSRSGNI